MKLPFCPATIEPGDLLLRLPTQGLARGHGGAGSRNAEDRHASGQASSMSLDMGDESRYKEKRFAGLESEACRRLTKYLVCTSDATMRRIAPDPNQGGQSECQLGFSRPCLMISSRGWPAYEAVVSVCTLERTAREVGHAIGLTGYEATLPPDRYTLPYYRHRAGSMPGEFFPKLSPSSSGA